MDKSCSRRISAPVIPLKETSPSVPPYRSLRIERRHRITKEPDVSVILETDSEITTEDNNKPKLESSKIKPTKLHRNHSNSNGSSIHKEVFDIYDKNERQISRESGISNCSSLNGSICSTHSHHSSRLQHQTHENKGFSGSSVSVNGSLSTVQDATVIREQYWSCSKCCCRSWTRREKILIWIVMSLVFVICGLFAIVGFLADKNGNGTFSRTLYSWKL